MFTTFETAEGTSGVINVTYKDLGDQYGLRKMHLRNVSRIEGDCSISNVQYILLFQIFFTFHSGSFSLSRAHRLWAECMDEAYRKREWEYIFWMRAALVTAFTSKYEYFSNSLSFVARTPNNDKRRAAMVLWINLMIPKWVFFEGYIDKQLKIYDSTIEREQTCPLLYIIYLTRNSIT